MECLRFNALIFVGSDLYCVGTLIFVGLDLYCVGIDKK